MYGFLKEIGEVAGVPLEVVGASFKVCMLGENIVHVSNFSKILVYLENEVSFRVKGGVLKVVGESLCIAQLSPKEIVLKGKVSTILFEKSGKR